MISVCKSPADLDARYCGRESDSVCDVRHRRKVIMKDSALALDIPLEASYNVVSETYKGSDIDIHEACKEMRQKSPIYEGDFIAQFGVPTNAGLAQGTKPTFTLFDYDDVKKILLD